MSYPHRRLRELVQDWTELGTLSPEDLLTHSFALREYIAGFQKEAAEPTGIEETEAVYEAIRLTLHIHMQACDLLIEGIMAERLEDSEQVLELAADGDFVGAEANQEAERLREAHGFTG